MEIQELGARIKRIRKSRGLTLKDIEARSQVSATHISEIERGKTSSTIGALSRIASALGKDTAFFLETQNLDDVCKIKYEDRSKSDLKTTDGYYQPLTYGIPGGRLQAYRVQLNPRSRLSYQHTAQEGEATLYVESGRIRFAVEKENFEMGPGDSMHFTEAFAPAIENLSGEDTASIFLVSTRRHSLSEL